MADLGVDPNELRGMDLEAALIFVEQRNSGIVTNGTVRTLLVEAGIFNGVKQMSHKLSQVLGMSELFEQHGGRGRYKLIADEEPDIDIPF